jgi:hypothetical protein
MLDQLVRAESTKGALDTEATVADVLEEKKSIRVIQNWLISNDDSFGNERTYFATYSWRTSSEMMRLSQNNCNSYERVDKLCVRAEKSEKSNPTPENTV